MVFCWFYRISSWKMRVDFTKVHYKEFPIPYKLSIQCLSIESFFLKSKQNNKETTILFFIHIFIYSELWWSGFAWSLFAKRSSIDWHIYQDWLAEQKSLLFRFRDRSEKSHALGKPVSHVWWLKSYLSFRKTVMYLVNLMETFTKSKMIHVNDVLDLTGCE